MLALQRIVLGWLFFWAFVDKLFGLGFAEENAWLSGSSPTLEHLTVTTGGPLTDLYGSLAGQWAVDALFMAGIGAVGISLLLGIGVRVAGVSGALMHVLMWSTHLPPEVNPAIDEHILAAAALLVVAVTDAGTTWGLGRWWERQGIAKRYPFLK
jgi:thiosulfate dehydrogenase [quinone] large subunit